MDFLDAACLPPTPLPSHSVFLPLALHTPQQLHKTAPSMPTTPRQVEMACHEVSHTDGAKKRNTSRPPAGKNVAVEKAMRQCQLEKACLDGDVETAKKLPRGMLSEKLSSGEAPLHHAMRNQYFAFVEFLVQHGVDINTQDEKGRTALQIAAAINDKDAMCRLIELGADVKAQDNLGLLWLKSRS
jgi:hypothetical protein